LNVVPLLFVFHTFPEATATKYSEWLSGFTAKSAILPDVKAGPMLRNFKPEKVLPFRESFSAAAGFFLA
jgi:hypothetical protein